MKEAKPLIGDNGVVRKTDRFGMFVIVGCSIISAILIILGILAVAAG